MAKPNYAFAKRQRDLAKQQKKQEKEKRKSAAKDQAGDEQNRPAESTDSTVSASHQVESPTSGDGG